MHSIRQRLLGKKIVPVGAALWVLGAACLCACGGGTSVRSGWKESAQHASFSRVLIVGISANFTQRCAFEWSLSQQIASDSTQVFISCDSMTSKDPLTRANIERIAVADRADAVLTTAVVSMALGGQKGNTRDTRATPYYQVTGEGWVTGDLGAYGVPVAFVELTSTPSITQITGDVHVLTKVFEANGASLVYTMDTEAKSDDIQSSSTAIDTITGVIAARLRRDGLIH